MFRSELNIVTQTNPLGFQYGADCFGPQVENRKLDDIRKSLLNPSCEGPETVYTIAMKVQSKIGTNIIHPLERQTSVIQTYF